METPSRGKRKRNANANSRMVNVIVAVAVFLLMLALVNVIFLHSHMHTYSSNFDLVSQNIGRPTAQKKKFDVSIRSLLEANNVLSFSNKKDDFQACPGLPQTACSEEKYAIIAVCSGDHLPILVQKVLQWMHDPLVHQIYILLPSSVRTIMLQDPHYGARLLHWEDQHTIQLVFADSLGSALHAVDLKTGGFVWVPEPEALIPNKKIREAFALWKSDASRSIAVSNSIKRQWFVMHCNWLCFLRSMTSQTSNAWDTTLLDRVFSSISSAISHDSSPNSC